MMNFRTLARWLPLAAILAAIFVVTALPFAVQVAAFAAMPPSWALAMRHATGDRRMLTVFWMVSAASYLAFAYVPPAVPAQGIGSAASLAAAVAVWWWRRRKDRRRALAAWGQRELARLRSMVTTLRERAKPRPVFRPGKVPA